MKLGAASRHLMGELIAMGDCEECRRVYCECGAGGGGQRESGETFSATLELLRQSLGFCNLRGERSQGCASSWRDGKRGFTSGEGRAI